MIVGGYRFLKILEKEKSWVGLFEEKDRSNTGFEVCRRAVTVFAIVM